ncbi:SpoIVB peptidase. Serine peptidase. MEROPS family S55 [Halobacillus karajensis]|uniref:SpoIVB peptidase n=1 Tax=Halobacillus karajensis TaxID=195088 RepID=A0A024P6L7_9BACI|nr:SpoIVB peptidase [Halobacillus karajensis]CDQ17885.1 SpoIVB peptidase precursor [Halobacillus karajensis]CDQ24291.1 SpoIVB peptidase precursor [Halobacillus karajensis]CDQ29460.1 SpoIVB peptidase precursor [Halobacillus karajensis]SEH62245.1 SpoIVB peptidase. Serine peptidase. MEROPS family S55 [Halobacillus karajensis]
MKQQQTFKYICGSVLLLFMLILPLIAPVHDYLSLPTEVKISASDDSEVISEKGEAEALTAFSSTDDHQVFYEFAGMPLKKADVSKMRDIRLIPGGQSVGVELHTKGVLVVGHHLVKGEGESKSSPGEEADVLVGDILLEGNGQELNSMEDLSSIVKNSGEDEGSIDLKIKRGKEIISTTLTPVFNEQEKEYQIGLYIRDSAAGIGTMTFYDPESKKYGALGHVISDMDTKKPIEIHEGTIVRSHVTSIEKGSQGVPGEKKAKFSLRDDRLGNITKNTPYGIFGKLDGDIKNESYPEGLPVGFKEEVEEGPAQIMTVLDGEEMQTFDVEIVSNMPKKSAVTKGMIVKITDPELLDKTGGIVQGMSGSPIIQNGKIIGAVTHVFVNDPTSGYGVHIEWMLQEAGIDLYEEKENKDKAS